MLNLVNNTKIKSLEIEGEGGYADKGKSTSTWLSYSWKTSSVELTAAFNHHGWDVDFYDTSTSNEIYISKHKKKE